MKLENIALEHLLKRNKTILVRYLFENLDYKELKTTKFVKKANVYVGIEPDRDVPFRYNNVYEERSVDANENDKGAIKKQVTNVVTYAEWFNELVKTGNASENEIHNMIEDFKQVADDVIERLQQFDAFLDIDYDDYRKAILNAIELKEKQLLEQQR